MMGQPQSHNVANRVAQRRGGHRRQAHVHAQRALDVIALETRTMSWVGWVYVVCVGVGVRECVRYGRSQAVSFRIVWRSLHDHK